jgi:MFS family permease
MSDMFSAYTTLFRTPGAMKFSVSALIGRMPISMDSLALIFIVVAVSDSYALAGALSAVASITISIATPFWSRLADRIGQRKMVLRVVPLKILGLSLFIALVMNEAPVWTWFASIILAELAAINTGGLVRRRWLHVLSPDKSTTAEDETDKHVVNTAYSYEALMDEIVFIVGPITATACATSIAPAAGLIAGMILMSIGLPLFAMQRATEPPPSPVRVKDPHPPVIGIPIVQAIALATTLTGGFFGAIAITVVGFAESEGQKSYSGLLLGLWASGSAVMAIINGLIKWKTSYAGRFLIFLTALTIFSIPFIFVDSIFGLAIALFFNGFAIAPLIVNAYGVVQEAVPSEQITESFTWVVAGMPLGGAIASALGGWVIETYGAQSALWVPLGFMCAALLATLPYFRVYKGLIHYSLTRD